MEPLRTVFPRLREEEVKTLVGKIQSNKDCTICETCQRGECLACQTKGKKAKDVLIESFIPLALSIAKRLGGSERREVISEALLALTEAVTNMPENTRSLEAYIRASVAGKIKTFLLKDSIIQVPRYGLATHKHLKSTLGITDDLSVHGQQGTVDLMEILDKVPRTKNEHVIFNCLLEGGYDLRDMARMCGIERARVSQIKHSLLERLQNVLRK